MLQLGAKASKRLQQNLVDVATESESKKGLIPLALRLVLLSLLEGGLFPDCW